MAVLAVLAFHAGVAGVGGGLLGVDVFFVLSGYLVTALLIAEWQSTGSIRLRRFWGRRARRLLPALVLTVLGVAVLSRWVEIGLSPVRLRGDILATLAYAGNWHFILTGQDYFVRFGAPSPLLHTWSLAVEEQFYLLWPLAARFVLRRWGRPGLARLAVVALAVSAIETLVLNLTGSPASRMYYGTDTRIQTIMAGVLVACVSMGSSPALTARPRTLGWAGIAGAVVLAACLHWVKGDGPFLYDGGFLLVAVAAAAVLVACVHLPSGRLARGLAVAPLGYLGRISYGLYLYHWPIFIVLTPARTHLGGWALVACRLAVTGAVAEASYRLVEMPVRTASPPRWLGRAGRPEAARRLTRGPVAVSLAAAAVSLAVAAVSVWPPAGAGAAVQKAPPPGYVGPGGSTPSDPESVLLIGDSMALTLGEGLGDGSEAWAVKVDNQGSIGCDLDPDTIVNVEGDITRTAQGCPDWRRQWNQLIAATDPDLVVVLLGRWECLDRIYDGRWTHPGDPVFDAHLKAELAEIVGIAAAHRTSVAFLTLPYITETTVQPDGRPWDVNLPARTDAYNADVRAVVASHPQWASVVDLNRLLDPGDRYVSTIDGIRVRDFDDEHISKAGGEWLRPYLLPTLARLGAAHFEARTRAA